MATKRKKKAKASNNAPNKARRKPKKKLAKHAKHVQLTLDDARKPDGKHGGWRPGAGRKKGRTTTPHDQREKFPARNPVLVTWRLLPDLPSLRHMKFAELINDAIRASHTTTFRITDFSIQTNHLHFVLEANGAEALSNGMITLAARLVRPINRAMRRRGKLLETRYHARSLATPREVKNALRYVINNARRHGAEHHLFYHPAWIDPFSSGPWFDGWREPPTGHVALFRRSTAEPKTWLRRVGWRRWGLIDFDEIPGPD